MTKLLPRRRQIHTETCVAIQNDRTEIADHNIFKQIFFWFLKHSIFEILSDSKISILTVYQIGKIIISILLVADSSGDI